MATSQDPRPDRAALEAELHELQDLLDEAHRRGDGPKDRFAQAIFRELLYRRHAQLATHAAPATVH